MQVKLTYQDYTIKVVEAETRSAAEANNRVKWEPETEKEGYKEIISSIILSNSKPPKHDTKGKNRKSS